MDTQDAILVESTVIQFIDRKNSFTAFDVTKTVRATSQNNIFHGEVKGEISRLYASGEMGNYERTIGNIGAPVEPFVYHDPNTDPFDYDPKWLVNYDPNQAVPVSASTQDDDDDDVSIPVTSTPTQTSTDTLIVKPAKDGRVTVSAKFVSQLQFGYPKQINLFVHPENDYLEINTEVNGSLTNYIIDEDNRIRISKRVLAKAGLDECTKLELRLIDGKGSNKSILVLAHPTAVTIV